MLTSTETDMIEQETTLQVATYCEVANLVKQKLQLDDLEIDKLYDIRTFGWAVPDFQNSVVPVYGLIRKRTKRLHLTFDDNTEVVCSTHHLFASDDRCDVLVATEMVVGDTLKKVTGEIVRLVNIEQLPEDDLYDFQIGSRKMLYSDLDGFVHHNTHTVEETLQNLGLEDGAGYFKNTSSGSPSGLYRTLFANRSGIVVLDDADTIVNTQEGRNLLKAALDTKKKRKLVWGKMAHWLFDPADDYEMAKADEAIANGEEPEKFPRYFDFEGRVIMISNLSLDVLDPDGALATRGFVMALNPTDDEVLAFMRKIAPNIKVEGGELSDEQRMAVVDLIERQGGDLNLRKLVRGLNMAASGVPNWERIIERYV
jgi:hypothetical protein